MFEYLFFDVTKENEFENNLFGYKSIGETSKRDQKEEERINFLVCVTNWAIEKCDASRERQVKNRKMNHRLDDEDQRRVEECHVEKPTDKHKWAVTTDLCDSSKEYSLVLCATDSLTQRSQKDGEDEVVRTEKTNNCNQPYALIDNGHQMIGQRWFYPSEPILCKFCRRNEARMVSVSIAFIFSGSSKVAYTSIYTIRSEEENTSRTRTIEKDREIDDIRVSRLEAEAESERKNTLGAMIQGSLWDHPLSASLLRSIGEITVRFTH